MDRQADLTELIKRARQGDPVSQNELAGLVRERLYEHVYRSTLRHDWSQDIVQESLIKMINLLHTLKRLDRFWPWLYGIAHNIIRNQRRREQIRWTESLSETAEASHRFNGSGLDREGLEHLIGQELKQLVFQSMRDLKPRHREVLTMRCYDNMEYNEIAEVLGTSEFGVRMLFFRAKNTLQKKLARNGLGKGALLSVLMLFGKMTAQSDASATRIFVNAGTLEVGTAAAVVGTIATPAGLTSLLLAGTIAAAGSMAVMPNSGHLSHAPDLMENYTAATWDAQPRGDSQSECWYYFPRGGDGPVMTRLIQSKQANSDTCLVLENDYANYRFDDKRNTVALVNCRTWNRDLSVRRLPTDQPQMMQFLSRMDNMTYEGLQISDQGNGLWVILKHNGQNGLEKPLVNYRPNILKEEYFQYAWPSGVNVEDLRDQPHQQGWCRFSIDGRIDGNVVKGEGQMPFVFEQYGRRPPCLVLTSGDYQVVDSLGWTGIVDIDTQESRCFSRCSFFAGLPRPWMGMHTIDVIRRDAAEKYTPFTTDYNDKTGMATIVLRPVQSVVAEVRYEVDMQRDWVRRISFWQQDKKTTGLLMLGELFMEFAEESQTDDAGVDMSGSRSDVAVQPEAGWGWTWLLRLCENIDVQGGDR